MFSEESITFRLNQPISWTFHERLEMMHIRQNALTLYSKLWLQDNDLLQCHQTSCRGHHYENLDLTLLTTLDVNFRSVKVPSLCSVIRQNFCSCSLLGTHHHKPTDANCKTSTFIHYPWILGPPSSVYWIESTQPTLTSFPVPWWSCYYYQKWIQLPTLGAVL